MRTTRLASIFNIHAEQRGARRPSTIGISPVTDASEDNLVGWCTAWFRSGDSIARIAGAIYQVSVVIEASRIKRCSQTNTIECVVETRVEVAFQAAFRVTHVRPPTVDAGIANDVVERNHTVRVANWSSDLATMCDITN